MPFSKLFLCLNTTIPELLTRDFLCFQSIKNAIIAKRKKESSR